jgi:hypothetical protein
LCCFFVVPESFGIEPAAGSRSDLVVAVVVIVVVAVRLVLVLRRRPPRVAVYCCLLKVDEAGLEG